MPTYEYRCTNCEKTFLVVMTMTEHDQGGVTCPACKSHEVVQQYSPFFARTSKKS